MYTASKAESERVARRFQADGAPVVTILPGGVWGPHDPHNGESNQIATNMLKGRQRMLTARGGFPIVDVRDVATAIAAAVEPGRGPRRYLVAGHVISSAQLSRELSRLTGRKRRFVTIPPVVARSPGALVNLVQRVAPFRLPLSNEMLQVGTQPLQSVDDSRANEELGYVARPVDETLRDTVRSLYEDGHITAKEAGLLAEE